MKSGTTNMNRRSALCSSAAGVAGLAVFAGSARATSKMSAWTEQEKAQVALVNVFCGLWGDKTATVDQIMRHMTEDCSFKISGQPATTGAKNVAALFETFFKGGVRYEMVVHETFATGPVVVHSRTDITVRPDKREAPGPIVGVYVFKDGKIQEWEEVIYKT